MGNDSARALFKLARDRTLAPTCIRVYAYLTWELDTTDYQLVKLHTLAAALGVRREHVSRALATLVRRQYLAKNGRAWPGGPFTYRLRPNPPLDEGPQTATPRAA